MDAILYNQTFSQLKPGEVYTLLICNDVYEIKYPISGKVRVYLHGRMIMPNIRERIFLNNAIRLTQKNNAMHKEHTDPDKFIVLNRKNRRRLSPIANSKANFQSYNKLDNSIREISYDDLKRKNNYRVNNNTLLLKNEDTEIQTA